MRRGILETLAAVAFLCLAALALDAGGDKQKGKDKTKEKHHFPHLHAALHELHGAHKELKEAKIDFGGNKEKAIKAVDAAIRSIQTSVRALGKDNSAKGGDKKAPTGHYPHMHHALTELKAAHHELKEATALGNHREASMRDVDAAIHAIEACLKHAHEESKDKKTKK